MEGAVSGADGAGTADRGGPAASEDGADGGEMTFSGTRGAARRVISFARRFPLPPSRATRFPSSTPRLTPDRRRFPRTTSPLRILPAQDGSGADEARARGSSRGAPRVARETARRPRRRIRFDERAIRVERVGRRRGREQRRLPRRPRAHPRVHRGRRGREPRPRARGRGRGRGPAHGRSHVPRRGDAKGERALVRAGGGIRRRGPRAPGRGGVLARDHAPGLARRTDPGHEAARSGRRRGPMARGHRQGREVRAPHPSRADRGERASSLAATALLSVPMSVPSGVDGRSVS